jgi:CDP-diacylglycerol--inositol 3-phosphatidyltransferase
MTKNGSANPSRKVRRRGSIDVVDAKVAVDLATAQTYSENVFLFIPNLIGANILFPCHVLRTHSDA